MAAARSAGKRATARGMPGEQVGEGDRHPVGADAPAGLPVVAMAAVPQIDHRPGPTVADQTLSPACQGYLARIDQALAAVEKAGVGMTKALMGKTKFLGEYLSQEKGPRHIENAIDTWLEEKGVDLAEWSDMMLKGVEEYYRNNTDKVLEVTPGLGYRETIRQYVTEPKKLVRGIIESSSLILEGILGTTIGGHDIEACPP